MPEEKVGWAVRRWPTWLWVGAFVMVPAVVAALVFVATRRADPPALTAEPLQVRLQAPATASVGATVPVVVAAVSPDAVNRLEVWAGTELVAAEEPNQGGTSVLTELPWPVGLAGTTTLVARAFDAAGRAGVSNPVTVLVSPSVELLVVADEETTLTELAGDAADLAGALNPDIDPDTPLALGTPVLLPLTELPGLPGASPGGAQALELALTADGCAVSAVVSKLTDPAQRGEGWSVELHRHLAGGGPGLVVDVVTQVGAQASFTDTPGPGEHLYSAVERNGVDQVTPLVPVVVADCSAGDTVGIEDGVLQLDTPMEGVFLYLSHGGTSMRLPESPAELITGDGLTFDLRPFLPPLPTTEVTAEVWGRTGGDVTLLDTLVLDPAALHSPQTSLRGLWDSMFFPEPLAVQDLVAFSNETVQFQWSSTVPHHGVRWFLARTKPGPATMLSPAGLAQTGLASATDNHFTVDLAANQVPSVVPLSLSQLGTDVTFAGLPPTSGGPSRSPEVHADAPGTTWVWAIPVDAAGNPVGPPSNLVRLVIKPPPYDPSVAPPYDVVEIKVTAPPAPNWDLYGCVRILSESPRFPRYIGGTVYLDGTPAGGGGGMTVTGALPYTLDGTGRAVYPFTACPGERKNFEWGGGAGGNPLNEIGEWVADGVEAGVGFVVDAVNWASETYAELKAAVISAVADVICPAEVKAECQTLIAVGVDVMLAAVGVPPSLPSFDDLANAAKGELVDLALEQLGVSEACDAVAESVTGKTCGEVAVALAEQDACALVAGEHAEQCRNAVQAAQNLCEPPVSNIDACQLATYTAKDLVSDGMGKAYDLAVQESQKQVTDAMYAALYGTSLWNYWGTDHGCGWGDPPASQYGYQPGEWVVCPFTLTVPAGCHVSNWGATSGKIVCSRPPPERVAIPEPRGHHRPIRVDVSIARNGNPLPEDFQCGPISAVATVLTPSGAVGQPYLPAAATSDITYDYAFDAGWIQEQHFTLWLDEANPFVQIDAKDLPAGTAAIEGFFEDLLPEPLGDSFAAASDWQKLLVAGSMVGVKVWGDCIGEVYAGQDSFKVADIIDPPLPRIAPGEQVAF